MQPDRSLVIFKSPSAASRKLVGRVLRRGRRIGRQRLGLIVGPVAAIAVFVAMPQIQPAVADFAIPDAPGAGVNAAALTAAVVVWMGLWWMFEAVPLAVTALLPIVIFTALGGLESTAVAAPYANPVVFLFLGGFVLAIAMQRWQLHRRIALTVLRFSGTRPSRLVLGFMIATALISMWVSNTATAVMMLPIGSSVLATLSARRGRTDRKLSASLMLGIAYAATIGSFGTIIASPPNALLVGYLSATRGIHIGFAQWMAVGVPLSIVFLAVTWLVLTRIIFRTSNEPIPGEKSLIRDELDRLGPITRAEVRVIVIFALTALCWVVLPLVWRSSPLTDEVIAVLALFALFLTPSGEERGVRLLQWSDTKDLPWGILLLFGGGLALAARITSSGLGEWIGERASGAQVLPGFLIIMVICALTLLLTEFMSNTAAAATLLPIMGGVAISIGADPLLFTVPVALTAACTFMMPAATPPNAIAISSGYVKVPQMFRAGAPLSALTIVLIPLTIATLGHLFLGIDL
ncbi:DASS family sodium-coupled anion symporter [Rarobacter faecitabidus]|uniref:Sodium-dependent dicarboxylate transporter SdcS n=1 Tax=Rarobacter faecitabidus TaxID=13243 RepID=A0A542ZVM1_RARFA|nr:DASS family sodium-coupled anion symporter [Rarobacter faecitabidus]TQL64407.1 sodium-dependent dicarboxylate transporter 2/3/5 [Rarobacter faecitabidus]